jgi:hypothetical protein
MLRVGRKGMESACPECLSYSDPTIRRGAPAESCSIPASWYTDPLAGSVGQNDAPTAAFDGDDSGCTLAVGATGRRLGLVSFASLVALALFLRRRRSESLQRHFTARQTPGSRFSNKYP